MKVSVIFEFGEHISIVELMVISYVEDVVDQARKEEEEDDGEQLIKRKKAKIQPEQNIIQPKGDVALAGRMIKRVEKRLGEEIILVLSYNLFNKVEIVVDVPNVLPATAIEARE